MAGDWIKMRVHLRRDPRVACMADHLAANRAFMEWVTTPTTGARSAHDSIKSDVTRAITVISLLEIWGVSRELGDRENDDLVVHHCTLDALDDVCGVPGFGAAMGSVRWAIEERRTDDEGREYVTVRFPKYFKDNESPDDRHRKQHAAAQAKYRAKGAVISSDITSDVTRDITVTPREEKRREVKTSSSSPPADEELFATFWAAYPRRVGKKDAVRAWQKLKPDRDLVQRLLVAIHRWRTTPDWLRDGGAFIPHPATWLNGHRWEDEPPTSVVPIKRVAL